MTNTAEPREAIQKRPVLPGFLFEPLGWTRDWFAVAVEAEPDLLREICFLSSQRMHLIALAMVHLGGSQGVKLPRFLLRESVQEVLDRVLGRRPRGLKRALNNLYPCVMPPEGYRRLIDLLDDPDGFKFLTHADFIDNDDLETLADIPVPLRPLLVPFIRLGGMWSVPGIIDGLRYLVARGAAPSFEALFDEFKPFRQPLQLCAHVERLVEALTRQY